MGVPDSEMFIRKEQAQNIPADGVAQIGNVRSAEIYRERELLTSVISRRDRPMTDD
jgi:hypothetical protein